MQYLTEKQLSNLSIPQIDEIRRELGTCISSAKRSFEENGFKADYTHMRLLEKYLVTVKAVLQRKVKLK